MPGIFGFIEQKSSGKLKETASKAKDYLMHLSHYCQKHIIVDDHLLFGISVPYELNGVGPYHDKQNGLVINFDGRIDYYLDEKGNKLLVRADTQYKIITDLYIRYGKLMPKYLSGTFNSAIYDQKIKKLFVFNDILGNRLLYYYYDGLVFIYGSELKTFIAYPEFRSKPNDMALADLFNFERIWGNYSLLDGVELLPAACILEMRENNKIDVMPYFIQRHTDDIADKTENELVDEGWDLLNQSVDRCLEGKTSVAVPISAGLDSRLLLSLVKERGIDFVCYTHADSRSCIEYRIAHSITAKMDVPRHEFILISPDFIGKYLQWVAWLNDGMELAGSSRLVGVARRLSRDHDGIMNGIFGGHMSVSDGFYLPEYDRSDFDFEKRYSLFSNMVKYRGCSETDGPPSPGPFTKPYSLFLYESAQNTIVNGLMEFQKISENFAEQIIYYIRKVFLRNMMNRIDINRYFQKDELIFGDPDLFRYYLGIPLENKKNNKLYYGIYKKYLPDLINMPTIHTGESTVRKKLDLEQRGGLSRFGISTNRFFLLFR